MEYVPGVSLGNYLKELHKNAQRLTLPQVLSLLKKTAAALNYAHSNNVIHRDIKPANILLTSISTPITEDKPLPHDVEPILTDFGLVRFLQSPSMTQTGIITGTPAYMSPEQAQGNQLDRSTDVYSLGITVYEMLSGRVPFDADTPLGLMNKIVNEEPKPIDGISESLQEVMDKVLAKNPRDRYQTPLEFAEAFEDAINQSTRAETMLFPSAITRSITVTRPKVNAKIPSRSRKLSIPALIVMTAGILALSVFVATRTLNTDPQNNNDPIETNAQPSDTIEAGPGSTVGLFRFQDGSLNADKVTFSSKNLPLPPSGSHYEAWLIGNDNETRLSLGRIDITEGNQASLTFVDERGQNLLTQYHGIEITIEPESDTNPNPSNNVAFTSILPPTGFSHVRHLLSTYPSNPNQTPFLRGLVSDSTLVNTLALDMLSAFEAGDRNKVNLLAEEMLNIIVGNLSEDHKDWNSNGKVDDPSDGFGMLLNGSNVGYIQGTFAHADLSLSSPDATDNMITHGEHVKIAATNVSDWTPQLRDQLIIILNSDALADSESAVRQAVVLANTILNGDDINGNENIEPIPGEGGALTAYSHSYYMADIQIFMTEDSP